MLPSRRPRDPVRRRRRQRLVVANAPGSDRPRAQPHRRAVHLVMVTGHGQLVPGASRRHLLPTSQGPQFFGPQDVRHQRLHLQFRVHAADREQRVRSWPRLLRLQPLTKTRTPARATTSLDPSGSHDSGFGGHYICGRSRSSVANASSVSLISSPASSPATRSQDFFAGRVSFHRQASENPVKVTQPVAGAYFQAPGNSIGLPSTTASYRTVPTDELL